MPKTKRKPTRRKLKPPLKSVGHKTIKAGKGGLYKRSDTGKITKHSPKLDRKRRATRKAMKGRSWTGD